MASECDGIRCVLLAYSSTHSTDVGDVQRFIAVHLRLALDHTLLPVPLRASPAPTLESVKCYRGERKIDLTPLISEILSQRWY